MVHPVNRTWRRPRSRSPAGFPSIRKDRGFTLVELLVVVAIISILAGLIIPGMMLLRERAYIAHCGNNLREIAQLAMVYADSSGSAFFPRAKGENPAAHESLNVLVEFYESANVLKPEIFICKTWRGARAEVDSEGKYSLTADSCAYTWTRQRLSPTDPGLALSSDKHVRSGDELSGHRQGMNEVLTDCSVQWVPEKDLVGPERLPAGLIR